MKITPELFAAFLKCPTKCWLRASGEPSRENGYADWVKSQDKSYRVNETARLAGDMSNGDIATSPDAETLKLTRWRLATSVRAHARVNSWTVESVVQAIERIRSKVRGSAAQFIPIRFIFRNKLTKDDKLLIAFDAFVLAQALGREMSIGTIIHGDRALLPETRSLARNTAVDSDETANEQHARTESITISRAPPQVTRVKTSTLAATVRKRLEQIAGLVASEKPPDLVLNRHCAECEFRDRCRQKAIETDDLSLLAGMSLKERQKLRSKGVFTVTQLSYTFRPRRRPKRLRDKREKYHHALKALAIREKKIHIVGSPELKIEGTPVYLDVEGLPDRDFYYLIGMRIGHGDTAVQHSLWADAVEDEGKIWREFLTILEPVEKPMLIHYGSYEADFLKKMRKKYNQPAEESPLAQAIGQSVNAHAFIFAHVYFPTHSNSLKEITSFLGCRWSEPQASGTAAIVWRHVWEQNQDAAFKQRLIVYNAEDTRHLEVLAQVISQLKKPHNILGTNSVNEIVQVDTMKRCQHFRWGEGEFSVDTFRSINQASYWDYQRGRIYVRLPIKKRRQTVQKKFRSRSFDRTVDFESQPPACPKCGHLAFRRSGHQQKIVYDLDFKRRGIVRRITRFRVIHQRCACCGTRAPEESLPHDKYGPGVVAFLVYHLVDLFASQEAVVRMLNDLFDMRIQGSGQINPIKARAAEYYRPTYERLLESIRHGQLVHSDETMANIQGKRTYVWVFTNLDEVVYVHSSTREADVPKKLLSEFRGVLVSDFYAAYDAIECRQQKCLIHLLRDMNTELLNSPFDQELKFVAEKFGSLLAGILQTIDRFGLKARFLRRHRRETSEFLDEMLLAKCSSESVQRFQNRFGRHREALFTFLELDGVPWNNNNAEHAIKAFARLRTVIRSASTERGISDYLVLLSVCQTCKYMGVDFLDFLRSGEKDIHAFAQSRRRRRESQPPGIAR